MEGKTTNAKVIVGILLCLMVALLLPQAISAATAPAVSRLLTLPGQEFAGPIAADSNGNIYVSDTNANVVKSFDAKGHARFSLSVQSRILSLAVSPSNLLLVGQYSETLGQGIIDVYTANGTYVRSLSCKKPYSIAFRSSGEMYLLDEYRVKKFDSGLNSTGLAFGSFGIFYDPMVGLAVNDATGEVYVVDFGSTASGSYGPGNVWRVQVIDAGLTSVKSSFSNYGSGVSGMVQTASAIAIDAQGLIYISDRSQPVIMIYDANGAYVSTIFYDVDSIYNPVSISIANSRLYATSELYKKAYVLGLNNPAQLVVANPASSTPPVVISTPASFEFTYQAGMVQPSGAVDLQNTGLQALTNLTASADAAWITFAAPSAQIAGGSSQPFSFAIDPTGLSEGTTGGNITFQAGAAGTEKVAVTVTVVSAPVLQVAPSPITISKLTGVPATPVDLSIQIVNDITNARTWNAAVSPSGSWIDITQKSGINNSVPAPQVVVAGEPPAGSYTFNILVSTPGANTVSVPVTLNVTSSSSITVGSNLATATFTVTGPITYSGALPSDATRSVPEGTYNITFDAVKGYKTPKPQTATVAAGGTITFFGSYTDLRQAMNIVASHGAGPRDATDVVVFRADGTQALAFTPFPTYKYGVGTAVGNVDGSGPAIIVGGGGGQKIPAVIKGFDSNGNPIPGLEFTAYRTKSGVNVTVGDFDGNQKDEIVTGDKKTTFVRVFAFDKGKVVDTGVYFEAYPGADTGVVVAAADVDDDGAVELITTPEKSDGISIPVVKIFKVDVSGGAGNWKASLYKSFNACDTISATTMTTGDIDGDGIPEILVLCSGAMGAEVRAFKTSGSLVLTISTASTAIDYIAAGDINADGTAELIIGDGSPSGKAGQTRVRIFDANAGTEIGRFNAFIDSTGVRVSVGNLGY